MRAKKPLDIRNTIESEQSTNDANKRPAMRTKHVPRMSLLTRITDAQGAGSLATVWEAAELTARPTTASSWEAGREGCGAYTQLARGDVGLGLVELCC